MSTYKLGHLADQTLLQNLVALVARDRANTASLIAHIAEVDARKLYLPAGFPSMYAYCVQELHLSEQAAFTRIRAARAAREYPAIFDALAEGRLHLSAVVRLSACLTPENADELLAATTHRSMSEIEQLLAQRCPQPGGPSQEVALPLGPSDACSTESNRQNAVAPHETENDEQLFPGIVAARPVACIEREPSPVTCRPGTSRGSEGTAQLVPQRIALRLRISQEAHDKLQYARDLLSHQIPSGDLARVLQRVLDLAIPQLEKRKFAATSKPRAVASHSTPHGRHIPSHVKRVIWQRDGAQCTFVSESGRRCPSRRFLEFDHVEAFARGGPPTVDGLRLRCRAHNQYAAERTFGIDFMRHKRSEARAAARTRAVEAKNKSQEEVIPWLRALGCRADEARRAAALCLDMSEASLEQRVRRALTSLGPRSLRSSPAALA